MGIAEIPLSRPDITESEIALVTEVMRSGRLALGPMAEAFETLVATRAERDFGVSVSSGTCGLHLALLALGIGPGDEVITTPFSFIASSNVILMVGATPVFVDIDPKSLNMDPAKVEAAITRKTKAILAVETFGNPAHMDAYEKIARAHDLAMIEDCCEALGASHRGRPAGNFGDIGVFAFYPNKQITTGEGGCIVTSNKRLAEMCKSLRNQGRAIPRAQTGPDAGPTNTVGSWLFHERLGFNYRMSEVNAAIGVGQMRRFDEIIARRQMVATQYMQRLMDNPQLILPTIHSESVMSWFVFVVRLASEYTREERDRVIAGLRRHEVGSNDYFPCIHLQPFYREQFGCRPGDFPIAESVAQRTIAVPFYNQLSVKDIDYVAQTLDLMISRENLGRN
jgi:perosamine synthetase